MDACLRRHDGIPDFLRIFKDYSDESPRGKPRGIFKGKIHFIAASCGELNPVDFASLLK
jgi:hypothetical protein